MFETAGDSAVWKALAQYLDLQERALHETAVIAMRYYKPGPGKSEELAANAMRYDAVLKFIALLQSLPSLAASVMRSQRERQASE